MPNLQKIFGFKNCYYYLKLCKFDIAHKYNTMLNDEHPKINLKLLTEV